MKHDSVMSTLHALFTYGPPCLNFNLAENAAADKVEIYVCAFFIDSRPRLHVLGSPQGRSFPRVAICQR